ncbi:MAG TPA: pilin [Candidatus Saccharimonadales bacterium]|nr:pilin [Candidatus Saccharimonadales bacterium]
MHKITRKIKTNIFLLALSIGLVIPAFSGTAHALFDGSTGEACAAVGAAKYDSNGNPSCNRDDNGPLVSSQDKLGNTIRNVLNLLTIVVGIMSVIMIVISGIRFVTSNGDSNKITSARNTLLYALVGLVIVAFAQIIVKLVLTHIA